jgi:hypothetical protein
MMKKKYIIPALHVQRVQTETMIAASILSVGGDTGIVLGEDDEAPEYADVKDNFFNEELEIRW